MFASRLVKSTWFTVAIARIAVATACLGMAALFGTATARAASTDSPAVMITVDHKVCDLQADSFYC